MAKRSTQTKVTQATATQPKAGQMKVGQSTAGQLKVGPAKAERAKDRRAKGRPAKDGLFGFDPEVAIAHLRESDAALGRIIDAAGPFRMTLKTTPSIFVALTEAIVYQQLTAKAAGTIFGRVCALVPCEDHGGPSAEQILSVTDEQLRGAGLSRQKLLSLRDLARRTVDGEIPTLAEVHGMEDEAIVERLTHVRGIGRWTVEMLLMFRLGRPDVLPVDDYGIRKGFAFAFKKRELPKGKDLEARGRRWQPYRTVASWYLWRAAELAQPRLQQAPLGASASASATPSSASASTGVAASKRSASKASAAATPAVATPAAATPAAATPAAATPAAATAARRRVAVLSASVPESSRGRRSPRSG